MTQLWRWLIDLRFMPHGQCILWDPWILFPRVAFHLTIFLSYLLISWLIAVVLTRRRDTAFSWIGWGFFTFILLCGLTHGMAIVVNWWAAYRPENALLGVTAFASALTAGWLRKHLPAILALPSIQQLQKQVDAGNTDRGELRGVLGQLQQQLEDLQHRRAEVSKEAQDG